MPKRQIVYSCKFCTRYSLKSKVAVLDHETYCFKNPKNKACKTCAFFKNSLRNPDEKEFAKGNISRCSKRGLMFYYDYEGCNTVEDINSRSILYKRTMFNRLTEVQPFPKKNCDLYKKK